MGWIVSLLLGNSALDDQQIGFGLALHRNLNTFAAGLARDSQHDLSFAMVLFVVMINGASQADSLNGVAVNVVQVLWLGFAVLELLVTRK